MLRLGRDGLTILRDEVLSDPKLEPVGEGPYAAPPQDTNGCGTILSR